MQEEISKHTKKAYKAIKSNHSWVDKLREIAIEICIIVFAVSLSIWLYGWSEHQHQQAEVNEFLADLKEDLKTDLISIENIQKKQNENYKGIEFALNLTQSQLESLQKIKGNVYFNSNFNTTKLNIGNYEDFKSSGKSGFIENQKIKKLMLNHNQDTVPNINDFEKLNNNQFLGIFDFISDNANKNTGELFLSQKFKVKFKFFERTFSSNLKTYNQVAKEIKERIGEIEKTK